MLDIVDFRDYVVIPTLKEMDMYSAAAVNLLLGTAIQESRLTYLKQKGGGTALGVYQMEPATHEDLLAYASRKEIDAPLNYMSEALVGDMFYATVMARIHYWRRPEPLPDKDDVEGLANYWKDHYNTRLGKGTVSQFILHYNEYVRKHAL